jgi:hypothetical protein
VTIKFLTWRESAEMKSLVYECDVEWLRPFVEGGLERPLTKPVKWQKLEDVAVVGVESLVGDRNMAVPGDTNALFRMLVVNGGVYKGWVEVRKSGVKEGYGLFAVTRFEKGSIITAKIPCEIQLLESVIPTKDTLYLGWNWVAKKSLEELGPTINAVYLRESMLIRACTRIMPGTEILLDREQLSVSNGLEWLDSLVFMESREGWTNWHARRSIGRVVSGDKGRGFVVKFEDGSIRKMNEAKLEELAVSQNTVVGNKTVQSYEGRRENEDENEIEDENEDEIKVEVIVKNDVEKNRGFVGCIGNNGRIEKKRKGA